MQTFCKNRVVPRLVVALLFVSLAACQRSAPSQTGNANAQALPPVVANVNGREVSTKLYEMYLKNGRDALGLELDKEEGRRLYEHLKEGIVSELIDRTLVAQEAERRGLAIAPERMAEAERRTIAQFGGDQKYDEYLSQNRLTRDEYREVLKTEIYGELMRAELKQRNHSLGHRDQSFLRCAQKRPCLSTAGARQGLAYPRRGPPQSDRAGAAKREESDG